MSQFNGGSFDFLAHGDRRKAERRQQAIKRRGILRWDPLMRERRLGKDRRMAGVARAR